MVTTIKTWEDIKQFCTEYDKLGESDNFWEKLLNTVDFNSDDLKHFTFEIHEISLNLQLQLDMPNLL